jgi:hypothetical protein
MRAIPTVPLSRDTMYHSLTPNKKNKPTTLGLHPAGHPAAGSPYRKKKEKERENKKKHASITDRLSLPR